MEGTWFCMLHSTALGEGKIMWSSGKLRALGMRRKDQIRHSHDRACEGASYLCYVESSRREAQEVLLLIFCEKEV